VRAFELWGGVCKRRYSSGGLSEITPFFGGGGGGGFRTPKTSVKQTKDLFEIAVSIITIFKNYVF
jgi:hypothetical protein